MLMSAQSDEIDLQGCIGGVAPVPPQENFLKEVFLTFKNFEWPKSSISAKGKAKFPSSPTKSQSHVPQTAGLLGLTSRGAALFLRDCSYKRGAEDVVPYKEFFRLFFINRETNGCDSSHPSLWVYQQIKAVESPEGKPQITPPL